PLLFFFSSSRHPRALHSFPTRRSSDLSPRCATCCSASHHHPNPRNFHDTSLSLLRIAAAVRAPGLHAEAPSGGCHVSRRARATQDRKSTRLNSSHDQISYAVFCLKKKK